MKIKDVMDFLDSIAPPSYQESYDNSGLLIGDPHAEATGILVTLDCLEDVVAEAIDTGVNLIVSHHPIIFKGLKSITGKDYIERTILKAIKNDIAIYAIHTNLDNILSGVNAKIAEKIGLINTRILSPKAEILTKLVTFIPSHSVEKVMLALYEAGAGNIGNYKNCSFSVNGKGTFLPTEKATPHTGTIGALEHVDETRIEIMFESFLEKKIITALKQSHPYEEVAYYLTSLRNENQEVGSGMIGELETPLDSNEFLEALSSSMDLRVIRHTKPLHQKISKVAVCGGSGSFLLKKAMQAGAQAFVSADFKYHEFFDADGQILIADIGHYESEVFTKELLIAHLIKKFPTFAINFSKTVTNPIRYSYKLDGKSISIPKA